MLEKQLQNTKFLYYVLGFCILISIIPSMIIATIAPLAFIGLLIAAYVMRSCIPEEARETSLFYNHASFMIASIWIATGLSLVTLTIGSIYMFSVIDYTPFEICANRMAQMGPEFLASAGYAELYEITQPCMDDFILLNKQAFLITTVVSGLPVLAYLGYRGFKGGRLGFCGQTIPDLKSWF